MYKIIAMLPADMYLSIGERIIEYVLEVYGFSALGIYNIGWDLQVRIHLRSDI